jgi:hypothetical protein
LSSPPFVYLFATDPAGRENRILRFRLAEGGPAGVRLEDERVLLGGIPAGAVHDGGRLAFRPDGMLYATTGDAGEPDAAEPRSLAGKILRLAPDGSAPDTNPFPGSPAWSYGHRNPQGLAWDAGGRLYASDHGPTGEFGLCCHDDSPSATAVSSSRRWPANGSSASCSILTTWRASSAGRSSSPGSAACAPSSAGPAGV